MINYEAYMKHLRNMLIVRCIAMAVLIILALILLIFVLKYKDNEDRKLYLGVSWGFLTMVMVAAMFFIIPPALDVSQEALITYEGEFIIEEYYGNGPVNKVEVKFPDDEKPKPYNYEVKSLDKGRYCGYIVYSKRTKIIFSWGEKEASKDMNTDNNKHLVYYYQINI